MTETSWKPFLRNFEPDKIDKNIDLVLVPTVNENINNAAITELSVNEPAIILGKETSVRIKLSNYSEKATRLRVALAINDETKVDKELELEANSEKESDFKIVFQKKGMNKLTASINGDSLFADNKRYEAVRVFEPYKVLIVKPENNVNKVNNEDIFVKFALNPLSKNKNNIFITESRTPSELNNLNINLYSAVILINQRHLSKDFVKQLSNYVISGGSLITFLGDKTEPDWYNKNLNQDLGENYILPAKLFKRVGNAVSKSSYYNMTDIDYEHLAFKALKNENSGINSARIYEFFQIRPNERSLLLCKMNHGFPGIVEEKRGNGRSMLVTFSPDTIWSNWPTKPSWLPFLHSSIIYMVTANEITINNMRAGMAVSENIPYTSSEEIIMKMPNGENGRLSKIVVNDNLININSKDTEQAGYYEIIANNKTITAFAVNPSPEESNLKRIPVKEIPRFTVMSNEIDNSNVKEKINALKSGYDLSMLFMILLIITALLEHWLANIPTEKRTA